MTYDPEDPHLLPLISSEVREYWGIKLNYTRTRACRQSKLYFERKEHLGKFRALSRAIRN